MIGFISWYDIKNEPSINKTNFTIFSYRNISDGITISIIDNEVTRLPVLDFLGVLLD